MNVTGRGRGVFGRGVAAPVVLGLLCLAWPLAWAPVWVAVWVAPAGTAAAVAGAVAGRRWAVTLVVAVAVVACGLSRAGDLVMAAEGLFILGYLLVADVLIARLGALGAVGWLRRELPALVAGVVASALVLGALAVRLAVSPWLTMVGLIALVIAYRIAVPATRRRR